VGEAFGGCGVMVPSTYSHRSAGGVAAGMFNSARTNESSQARGGGAEFCCRSCLARRGEGGEVTSGVAAVGRARGPRGEDKRPK